MLRLTRDFDEKSLDFGGKAWSFIFESEEETFEEKRRTDGIDFGSPNKKVENEEEKKLELVISILDKLLRKVNKRSKIRKLKIKNTLNFFVNFQKKTKIFRSKFHHNLKLSYYFYKHLLA